MNSEWQHMFGGLNSPVSQNNQTSANQLTTNSLVNNSPFHQQTNHLNDAASLSEPEGSYVQCEYIEYNYISSLLQLRMLL